MHGADAPRGYLPDGEFAASPQATAAVDAFLPDGWRRTLVTVQAGRMIARFRDERGRVHALEWQRAQPRAERLVFRYRAVDRPDREVAERCRPLFLRMAERASDLLPWLPAPDAPRAGRFVQESDARRETGGDPANVPAWIERAVLPAFPPGSSGMLDLFLDAACDQNCQFCHVAHGGAFAHHAADDGFGPALLGGVLGALGRLHPVPVLNVSGGDWARHPAVEALLARLEQERVVPVTLQGPSTRLADEALARRVAALPTLSQLLLTLESADPARHDAIVGRSGAGADVLRAIENLRSVAPLRILLVLSGSAVEGLAETLAWLDARRLFAALVAFLPDRLPDWEPARLMPRMDDVRRRLDAAGPLAERTIGALIGLPPCAVPAVLRERMRPAAHSPGREPMAFGPRCERCAARRACPGVPAPWLRAHPDGDGLEPLA